MKKINLIFTAILVIIIAMIISSPAKFINSALNGLSAWTFKILPSVLPFMIFTKLLTQLGIIERCCQVFNKPFKKIYGTTPVSAYVFLMSILSGYPVGSKMIADLYENGTITRQDAYRMSSFCSNSGPMFIVGSVGAQMFLNPIVGYIILISHIISALVNGLIYRKIKVPEEINLPMNNKEVSKEINIGEIVLSSVQSILSVGAIVAVFFIIIECLMPIFNLFNPTLRGFMEAVIEITKGCIDLSKLSDIKLATILSCFVITFGGFSTIIQSIALLKKVKMPIWLFTIQKLTQALISSIICFLLCLICF